MTSNQQRENDAMTRYEQGFDAGERMAFRHAKQGIRNAVAPDPKSEYARGFADGYNPRTLAWAARPKPERALPSWWADDDIDGAAA